MQYEELSLEELVILAVEFICREQDVPKAIQDLLGPSIMLDLLPQR